MTYAIAVLAGGLGAVTRFVVTLAVQRRADADARGGAGPGPRGGADSGSPWGTAVVNVTGAVVLGVIAGLVGAERLGPDALLVVGGGFLGAYTTFSTWMVETVHLTDGGPSGSPDVVAAASNILGPLVVGLTGAAAGYLVGGLL